MFRHFSKQVKLTAYADDVTTFTNGTERDPYMSCSVLESFCAISGLKINHLKSVISEMGPFNNYSLDTARKETLCGCQREHKPRDVLYEEN